MHIISDFKSIFILNIFYSNLYLYIIKSWFLFYKLSFLNLLLEKRKTVQLLIMEKYGFSMSLLYWTTCFSALATEKFQHSLLNSIDISAYLVLSTKFNNVYNELFTHDLFTKFGSTTMLVSAIPLNICSVASSSFTNFQLFTILLRPSLLNWL